MAAADLAVFSDGAGDAECLEADAESLSSFDSRAGTRLDGDSSAYGVSPASIFESDRLNLLDDIIRIDASSLADIAAFFDAADAVFFQHAEDFIYSSVVTFEQFHNRALLIPVSDQYT